MTEKFLKHYYKHNVEYFAQFFSEWKDQTVENFHGLNTQEYQQVKMATCVSKLTFVVDENQTLQLATDKKVPNSTITIDKGDIVDVHFSGYAKEEYFTMVPADERTTAAFKKRGDAGIAFDVCRFNLPIKFLDAYQCAEEIGDPQSIPHNMI